MDLNEQKLLTVVEASKLLRVQSNTIRVWLSKGETIPAYLIIRLGRRVLFDRKQLIDWIENGCKPCNERE